MKNHAMFVSAMLTLFSLAPLCANAEPVKLRGVVEGYYGRPWGTEGRLSLLKFMGKEKMNVFIYGPKDDPYHHGKWREPYPEREMTDFAKLLKCAKENKVNFYWAIHLGGSFKKGNEADYEALFKKLGWMYDAGFRSFAVFFDDFGGADAAFHAEICNRILNDFLKKRKDCSPLIMCPNVYWGSGHPYQKTLGAKLDKAILIMWTGATICSDIRKADVEKITADFQRPPFIWWNWPVNDYCRSKVLLGRTYGLESAKLAGFVSNPMENCEANKIALYGIAAWCRDPEHFDSRKNWEESFTKLYPDKEIAEAMRIFAEHNSDQGPNGHRYRREESVGAAKLCKRAREEYAKSGKLAPATAEELRALFMKVGGAAHKLRHMIPTAKGLGWELQGWFDAEICQMVQGQAAINLLKSAGDADKTNAALRKLREIRKAAAYSADKHKEKFAAATFAGDKGHIRTPEVSTLELKPTIMMILEGELKRLYTEKTGQKFSAATGFQAGSSNPNAAPLQVSREGLFAGIVRVLEKRSVEPGGWISLSVPNNWPTTYFHAKLGDNAAVRAGAIELSKDGKTWKKITTNNSGEQMQTRLNPNDGWRHARYVNVSEAPVDIKLNLFKFDVSGDADVIDALLEALAN